MEENEIAEEQIEQVETQQETISQDLPKKDVEHNWNEAREVFRLQKQRIEELEARLHQPPPQAMQEEKDELDALDPDDSITVAQARAIRESAKKEASKEATKASKQLLEEHFRQQHILQDEERMRSKHDDFDYVMEKFAIPMIQNDPALAYKIQGSKNPAEAAYKLAKISDEYEEVSMKQQISPKAEKILKNSSRPVSSNAVGSPLKNQAEDFSKMSQQDIWSMSQKYARQA